MFFTSTANHMTVSWVQQICCQTSHQTERNQPLLVIVIVAVGGGDGGGGGGGC